MEEEEEEGEKKKNFDCEPCGKTYRTRDLLSTHIYNHNKNLQDAALVKSEKFEDKDKDESVLVGSDAVDSVMEEKIDSLVEKKDGMWTCMQCGKCDTSRFGIRRHAETHIEGFSVSCTFCGDTFARKHMLTNHINFMHPEEKKPKPFNCDICGKPSQSLRAVKVHKERNHKD